MEHSVVLDRVRQFGAAHLDQPVEALLRFLGLGVEFGDRIPQDDQGAALVVVALRP